MNKTFTKRLRKSLHYGFSKDEFLKGCSLPLTEVAVDLIRKTISNDKECLGELDVNYASHILHQASISPASIMIAVLYLERLKMLNVDYLNQITSSELFLISLVVASKFLFDKGENEAVYNDQWAEFADLELEELNNIEKEFLSAINWSCYVDNDTFLDQLIKFEGLISIKESFKRSKDPLTYTETICLFDYIKHLFKSDTFYLKNITDFAQIVVILSVAYCVAVCILITSFSVGIHIHSLALSNIEHLESNSSSKANQTYFNRHNLRTLEFDVPASMVRYNLVDSNTMTIQPNRSETNYNLVNFDFQLFAKNKYNKILKC